MIQRCTANFCVFFQFNSIWSHIFHPCIFSPAFSGPAFSGPAFFYPGNMVSHFPVVSVALWSKWSLIGLSFSGPAFSVDPLQVLYVADLSMREVNEFLQSNALTTKFSFWFLASSLVLMNKSWNFRFWNIELKRAQLTSVIAVVQRKYTCVTRQ